MMLAFAALAWGISVAGVVLPWQQASGLLQELGAQTIVYDPMLDYWLRMAAGAFGLIGAWYAVLAMFPRKFAGAIPYFGALMIVEGLILLTHGLRLQLPPFPFYADTAACLLGGSAILYLSPHASCSKEGGFADGLIPR